MSRLSPNYSIKGARVIAGFKQNSRRAPPCLRRYAPGAPTRSLIFLALLLAGQSFAASAHGGGVDANGCHTNRKTGDFHCHGGLASPAPSVARSSLVAPTAKQSSGVFRNCAAARAAGAAPVRRGDPGYGPHLDRDNDGIGCEPYRGR